MATPAPTLVLATVSGRDAPGIFSGIMGVLSAHPVTIVDLAQAVLQQRLSFSILFEGPQPDAVIAALKTLAANLKLEIEIERPAQTHARQVRHDGPRYALTLIGADEAGAAGVSPRALHDVTALLATHQFNIDSIQRLSETHFGCVELSLSRLAPFAAPAERALRKELLLAAKGLEVDIALQAEGLYRRAKRLIVMDMDSTLIQAEVIDELAREKGVYESVAAITHQAMAGKIDYDESLRSRVALLKGLTEADLERVRSRVPLTPGAPELIRALKRLGYKIALISGGFTFVADRLKESLGIDFAYANTLDMKDGKVTGLVHPPIVNAQRKADLLDVIAQQEKITLDQVIAVGDGANDLLMLEKAGLGIAFNAKASVRERADLALSQKNLRAILYLLGLSARDIAQVL